MCACVHIFIIYMCIRIYVYIYMSFPFCLLSPLRLLVYEKTSLHIYVNACTVVWTIGGNSWTEWRSMTFFSIFFLGVLSRTKLVSCLDAISFFFFFFFFFVLRFDRATPGLSHRVKKVSFCTLVYFMSQRERRNNYKWQMWVCTDSWYILGENSSAGSFCHISRLINIDIISMRQRER